MEGWWDVEHVGVGLVLECEVEVFGVAGEDALRDDESGALEVVCVAISAVEHGRVEDLSDIVNGALRCVRV